MSREKEIRDALTVLDLIEMPTPSHEGFCSPETPCDTVCMDRANIYKSVRLIRSLIDALREENEKLKKSINPMEEEMIYDCGKHGSRNLMRDITCADCSTETIKALRAENAAMRGAIEPFQKAIILRPPDEEGGESIYSFNIRAIEGKSWEEYQDNLRKLASVGRKKE